MCVASKLPALADLSVMETEAIDRGAGCSRSCLVHHRSFLAVLAAVTCGELGSGGWGRGCTRIFVPTGAEGGCGRRTTHVTPRE